MEITNSNIAYLLDNREYILSVEGAWDEFAYKNDGESVYACDVCGRSIWDFVNGDVTRMWLSTVFQLARLCNMTVERPYRCDSPHEKRFMRMRIIPERDGVLRIMHELLMTEKLDIPLHIKCGVEKAMDKVKPMLRCSFCGRVRQGELWEEPSMEHAGTLREIIVGYSLCENCAHSMPGIKNDQTKKNERNVK